jgi:hypothetical protein
VLLGGTKLGLVERLGGGLDPRHLAGGRCLADLEADLRESPDVGREFLRYDLDVGTLAWL